MSRPTTASLRRSLLPGALRAGLFAALALALASSAATCRDGGGAERSGGPAPTGGPAAGPTRGADPAPGGGAPELPTRDEPTGGAPMRDEPALPPLTLHPAGGPAVTLGVEVVRTPAARARGLMYRRSLAADRGMLFVFEEERDWPFWMKNTYIPLDLIYIDSSGRVVGIVADLRPLDETSRSAGTPATYVLEVNAGSARRWGLRPGDRVELPTL